jgi:predicted nucleic acid-binding protein
VELPEPLYCDTSALLKLYLPEPGSDEFNEIVKDRDDVLVSDLTVTEIISAMARRMRQGSLARAADALHLALATSAWAASLASFDARLAGAGRAAGLAVYPS